MAVPISARQRLLLAVLFTLTLTSRVLQPLQAQDTPPETPLATVEVSSPAVETPAGETPTVLTTEDTTPAPIVTLESSPIATVEPATTLTDEPASLPTAEVILSPSAPTWILAFGSPFEAGLPPELGAGAGWVSVALDGGQALQNTAAVSPFGLAQPLLTSAIEVKAWLNAGTLSLTLREQDSDFYRAAIDASGGVSLSRSGQIVATTVLTEAGGSWQTWRLEAYNTTVAVSFNGRVILSVQDAAPLGAGRASVSALPQSVLRVDDIAIYSDIPIVIASVMPTVQPTAADIPPTPTEMALPQITATEALPGSSLPTTGDDATPPDVPVLNALTVVSDTMPTLSWHPVADAVTYYLDVSRDNFTTFIAGYENRAVTGASFTPATSFLNQTEPLYWRVRAADAAGNISASSTPNTFEIQLELTPADNVTVTANRLGFTWASVGLAGGTYTLEIDNDSDFSSPLISKPNLSGTSYMMPADEPALQNGTYSWRVRHSSETYPGDTGHLLVVDAPLPVPTLDAPVNGAVINWTPTFTWAATSYKPAATFRIQVDDNSDFSSPVVTDATLSTAYDSLPSQLDGTYYWRVALINNGVEGAYSTARSFTINTAGSTNSILTLAPVNRSSISTTRPVFTWQAVTGANGLLVQVDNDGDFTRGILYSSPILAGTATTFTLPTTSAPLPQGIHFWRVVRRDANGNLGNPAGTGSMFRLFLGTAPAPDAVVSTGRPVFSWAAAGSAGATYTLQIASSGDNNFSSPVFQRSGLTATTLNLAAITPLPTPLNSGLYNWRVLVNDVTALDNLSFSLRVNTLPLPAAPVLTVPALTNDATPLITLSAVPNGDIYIVEISTSSRFATVPAAKFGLYDLNVGDDDWSLNLPGGLADGAYFVRGSAQNGGKAAGPFSAPRPLVIDTTPLPTTSGLIPNSPTVPVTTVRPTFKWNAVTGTAATLIQIDTDGVFESGSNANEGSVYNATLGLAATYTLPTTAPALTQNQVYFWRVVLIDAAGNRSESAAAQVITRLGTSPSSGTVVTNGLPTLTWTSVPGVTGYNIQIDTDPLFSAPITLNTAVIPAATTSFKPAAPLTPGYYVWRVMPVGGGYGTALIPPALIIPSGIKPVMTAPVSGSVTSETSGYVFTWTDSSPVLPGTNPVRQYLIQMQAPNSSNQVLYPTQRSDANDPLMYTFPDTLTQDGIYTLRVIPIYDPTEPSFANVNGSASDPISLAIVTAAPAAPILIAPAADMQIPIRPTFSWSAVPLAVQYRLELDSDGDANFGTGVTSFTINAPATSYTVPASTQLRQGIWEWRVIAINGLSIEGSPSSASLNYATATLTPANGAFGVPLRPTFTWSAISGATGYMLQVSANSNYHDAIYRIILGPVTSYTVPASEVALTANTNYFWRIVPVNNPGSIGGYDAVDQGYGFVTSATAPTAPIIISPTLPLNTWATSFNITVSALKDIAGLNKDYRVQIASDAAFANIVVDQSSSTPTLAAASYTLTPGSYFVRAKSCYVNTYLALCSSFGAARSFTIAPLPSVIVKSPIGTEVAQFNRPTFTWNAVPGAVRYQVTVDGQPDFLYTSPSVTTTSLTIPNTSVPLPQGNLVWRVTAFDILGTPINSADTGFNVKISIKPPNQAVISTLRPAFTWKAVPGATSYTLQLDTDSTFASVDYSFTGAVLSHTLPALNALADNTLYYWRVFPNTQPKVLDYGASSFVTQVTLPVAPVITTDSGPVARLDIDWDDLSSVGALVLTDYVVELSKVATFSPILSQVTPTSSEVYETDFNRPDLNDGVYYVRVRTRYQSGSSIIYGPYSAMRTYTRDTTAPAVPVIIAPAANTVLTTLRPTITWSAVTGTFLYQIDVAADSGFNAMLIDGAYTQNPSFTLPTGAVLPQIPLYVRVQARDAVGNASAYSPTRPLTLFIGKTPLDEAVTNNTKPTFTWMAQPGISNYHVQIDQDGDFSPDNIDYDFAATGTSFTAPVLPLGAYVWRVVTDYDNTPVGTTRLLLINPTPVLTAPVWSAPRNAIADKRPMLTWTPVSLNNANIAYDVQVSSSARFSSLLINVSWLTAPSFTPGSDLPEGIKYARVRARYILPDTGQFVSSAYSTPFTFMVDTIAPTAAGLLNPIQEGLLTVRTPVFGWSAAAGATTYRLEVGDTGDLSSLLYTTSTAALTHTLPGGVGLANGTYFWRVTTRDTAGNETASPIRTFTVSAP